MAERRSVIVTKTFPVEDAACDHGCKQVIRMTNMIDDTSWEMCILSFENLAGRMLDLIDRQARGIYVNDGDGPCD